MGRMYRLLEMKGWQSQTVLQLWITTLRSALASSLGSMWTGREVKHRVPVVPKPAMMSWAMGTGNQLVSDCFCSYYFLCKQPLLKKDLGQSSL